MDCFRCDGTGQLCSACGESFTACECDDEPELDECPDCDGSGQVEDDE